MGEKDSTAVTRHIRALFGAGAAAHFGVGFAPMGWSGMHAALNSAGFSDVEQSAAGLVSQGQRGVYDPSGAASCGPSAR